MKTFPAVPVLAEPTAAQQGEIAASRKTEGEARESKPDMSQRDYTERDSRGGRETLYEPQRRSGSGPTALGCPHKNGTQQPHAMRREGSNRCCSPSKRWVFTWRVEPPEGVVSGRFGSTVLFVAYSPLVRQWYWICPTGEEKISEPSMLLLDEEWARKHPSKTFIKPEKKIAIRRKRAQQLVLNL